MQNLKQLMLVLALVVVAVAAVNGNLIQLAAAQGIFDLPDSSLYGNVPATSAGASAQAQFNELVYGVVQAFRYIIGSVAILMAVYSGFKMVTGWGKEEVYQKARTGLLYSVVGLAAVGLAGEIGTIFNLEDGGFLKDPNQILRTTILFNQRTQIIITFIKYFIGGIAVLMLVRSGLRMITMGESEDKLALDKKNLIYSALGLVLIIVADTAISEVFYKVDLNRYPGVGGVDPQIDPTRGVNEIIGFTNLAVSIVGPIAVLALLAGGVMYITAGGEEEKMNTAKKLIITAGAGIILIYGAFALVSTFIIGQFGADVTVT